jgi:hypothetical protein
MFKGVTPCPYCKSAENVHHSGVKFDDDLELCRLSCFKCNRYGPAAVQPRRWFHDKENIIDLAIVEWNEEVQACLTQQAI